MISYMVDILYLMKMLSGVLDEANTTFETSIKI